MEASVLSESVRSDVISKISNLQTNMINVLRRADDKIMKLRDYEILALEFGMADAVDEIRECIKQIQSYRDDFSIDFLIKMDTLSKELEEDDVSVREFREPIRLRMKDLVKLEVKLMPGYINDLHISS
jgi:hypothetical protein